MENKNTNTTAAFTPTEYQKRLIFKKEHPFLFHITELGKSTLASLAASCVAIVMIAIFLFFGMTWGDALLACVGTVMAVFALWLPYWAFSYKESGKWVIRVVAICISLMVITAFVMYFGYICPKYGA